MNNEFFVYRTRFPIETAAELGDDSVQPLTEPEQTRLIEDLVPEVCPLRHRNHPFGAASLLFLRCEGFLAIDARGPFEDIFPVLERFLAAGYVVYDVTEQRLVEDTDGF